MLARPSLVALTGKRLFGRVLQTGRVPRHIGFIMDGNRRWARRLGVDVSEGHLAGYELMAALLELCYECGVECATVYAFLIENFKRPDREVQWLMRLAKAKFKTLVQHGQLAEEYGVRIKILGSVEMLPEDVRQVLLEAEEITKNNTRATLNVCFPYTSRYEMTHAIRSVVQEAVDGELSVEAIDEEVLNAHMYTGSLPPLDLLVRTSDTSRLSDFMLWQAVGSSPKVTVEFVRCLWPEFGIGRMAWVLLKWSFAHMYDEEVSRDEAKKNA